MTRSGIVVCVAAISAALGTTWSLTHEGTADAASGPAQATAPLTSPEGTDPRFFASPWLSPEAVLDAVDVGAAPQQEPLEWHEFYFTRAAYSSGGGFFGRRRQSWATDYPKADRQFLTVLKRLTNLDAYDYENAVLLTDPGIRRYPFLYALEVGYMRMGLEEIEGLRDYLLAGGFLVIDDFWGTSEWMNFEYQMGLVFPDRPIEELEPDHEIFSTYYDIDEVLQVPAYGRFQYGITHERDGYVPKVLGIKDDNGRLMVVINWNTDLGDAWEWAEQPDYPLHLSTFAYQIGVNTIVYAMSR